MYSRRGVVRGIAAAVLVLAGAGTSSPTLASELAGVPGIVDASATTMNTFCWGGRMFVRVHRAAEDGSYPVDVTARRMDEGSRWKVTVAADDGYDGEDQVFRRTAVDGEWSVTTRVTPNPAADDDFLIAVSASEVNAQSRGCYLAVSPARPNGGLTGCLQGLQALVSRRVDDSTVVVRYFLAYLRPDARWRIQVTAIAGPTRETVAFTGYTNKRGNLPSRVEFRGGAHEWRFQVVAINDAGRRCTLGLNPPNTATVQGSAMTLQKLFKADSHLAPPR